MYSLLFNIKCILILIRCETEVFTHNQSAADLLLVMAQHNFYSHTQAVHVFSAYKLGDSPKSHEYVNIVGTRILLSSKAILGASTLIALQARLRV